MTGDPNVQLMLQFQKGDENAFKQLYEKFRIPILNFIYRFIHDRRIAEELTQEVFLRVYKSVSSYLPSAKFSTWLYRIATNVSINERKASKYRYEIEPIESRYDYGTKVFEFADQKTHAKSDDKIVLKERQAVVRDAIMELTQKQRMALLFRINEQLSYKEIGSLVGCTEGAVKSIIFRAKTALKVMMEAS